MHASAVELEHSITLRATWDQIAAGDDDVAKDLLTAIPECYRKTDPLTASFKAKMAEQEELLRSRRSQLAVSTIYAFTMVFQPRYFERAISRGISLIASECAASAFIAYGRTRSTDGTLQAHVPIEREWWIFPPINPTVIDFENSRVELPHWKPGIILEGVRLVAPAKALTAGGKFERWYIEVYMPSWSRLRSWLASTLRSAT